MRILWIRIRKKLMRIRNPAFWSVGSGIIFPDPTVCTQKSEQLMKFTYFLRKLRKSCCNAIMKFLHPVRTKQSTLTENRNTVHTKMWPNWPTKYGNFMSFPDSLSWNMGKLSRWLHLSILHFRVFLIIVTPRTKREERRTCELMTYFPGQQGVRSTRLRTSHVGTTERIQPCICTSYFNWWPVYTDSLMGEETR